MAYRRRQQVQTLNTTRPSISTSYDDEDYYEDVVNDADDDHKSNSTSLAAKAIRASSGAHRDSSLSSAYGFNHLSPSPSPSSSSFTTSTETTTATSAAATTTAAAASVTKDSKPIEYISMKNISEPKQGFWNALARKAKSILDDDDGDNYASPQQAVTGKPSQPVPQTSTKSKYQNPYPSDDSYRKTDSPKLNKGLNAISSSINFIGNAVEEGLTIVENRTAGIIQETRKHIRKKPNATAAQNQATSRGSVLQQPQLQSQMETDQELQLKASRDVAMAMASKAKLLLRELKTVKADLAFAKQRCAQLEEENKILREHRERGDNQEDDDLIRLQLETLLSEKARLAHENSVYARENRFLREVVEYHQLTMQDVVYLDENTEEVTEVYPIKVVSNNQSFPTTLPPLLSPETSLGSSVQSTRDIYPHPVPPPGLLEVPKSAAHLNNTTTGAAVNSKNY